MIREIFLHTLIEPSAHETTWAHVLGLPVLSASTRTLYVVISLAALELAASGAGVALARAPATDSLVARLGLTPCLSGVSVIGAEAYHILHHENAGLSQEAGAFVDWLKAKAAG